MNCRYWGSLLYPDFSAIILRFYPFLKLLSFVSNCRFYHSNMKRRIFSGFLLNQLPETAARLLPGSIFFNRGKFTSYDVNKPEVPELGSVPSILLTRFYPWCIVATNQVEVPKSKIFLVARYRRLAL